MGRMPRRRQQPPVFTAFRVKDDVQGFTVRTRPKRDAGQMGGVIFLCIWLCGWAFGEAFAGYSLIETIGSWFAAPSLEHVAVEADTQPAAMAGEASGPDVLADLPTAAFLLVWLTFWTIGGAMAIRQLAIFIAGGQEAVFTADELTLRDRPFGKATTYPLRELKRMRVASQEPGWSVGWDHHGEKVRLGVFRRPQDAAELMNAIAQRNRTLAGQQDRKPD